MVRRGNSSSAAAAAALRLRRWEGERRGGEGGRVEGEQSAGLARRTRGVAAPRPQTAPATRTRHMSSFRGPGESTGALVVWGIVHEGGVAWVAQSL
jgi:hypothetical protein